LNVDDIRLRFERHYIYIRPITNILATSSIRCVVGVPNVPRSGAKNRVCNFILALRDLRMSQDKRRRTRVQGGWAVTEKAKRSDADKPKVPPAPAWLAKTVDVPQQTTRQKFVYEETTEVVYNIPLRLGCFIV